MRKRRVTMQDVADAAGVSKSAVSLAFNDTSRLSPLTLRRILETAQDLGYAQDPAARMLRTRKTNSLGLLLPQQLDQVLENPYYSMFLQGIGATCSSEGYTLLLAPPLRGSMLRTIPYAAVDGFLVSGLENDRGEVMALRSRGIPFVLVDSEFRDDVTSVEVDDSVGTEQLVNHVLDMGHRRVCIFALETGVEGGPSHWTGPMRRRIDGVTTALEAHGLSLQSPGITLLEVPATFTGGYEEFRRQWRNTNKPTAIVAFSDIVALGALAAAREMNVSVPQEVSVTGFDDLREASLAHPSLTTVRQPIESKGRLAAELLIDAINRDTPYHPERRLLHTTLLLRESVSAPPSDRVDHP